MMIGHDGPRTVLKCKMRGIRLVRGRSSIIKATLSMMVPLYGPSNAGAGVGVAVGFLEDVFVLVRLGDDAESLG